VDEVDSAGMFSLPEEPGDGKGLVDINTASLRKLITLPGVGRALARRIIDQRPFQSIDDFRQKCRIKDSLWEKLEPNCTLSSAQKEGNEAVEHTQDEEVMSQSEHAPPFKESQTLEEPSGQVVSIVPLAELPPKNEKSTEKESKDQVTASSASWWIALIVGVIVLCLSIVINIGVLTALNGGLRYVSLSDFVIARQEVDSINERLQEVRSDLGSLQERLDNLQGLSGRMDSLESNRIDLMNQLAESKNEVKQVQSNIEDVSLKVKQLSDQVQETQKQATLFKDFVLGLRKLLETLQP